MAKKIAGEKPEVEAILMGGELDRDAEVAKLETERPEVYRLIQAGEIVADITYANRTIVGVKYKKAYLRLKPVTGPAVLAINPIESTWVKSVDKDGNDTSDFDGACWVKDFYYGNDLAVKNKVSQGLAVDVEGPDKAMKAAAKNLAKAWGISEDEAAKKIAAMSA